MTLAHLGVDHVPYGGDRPLCEPDAALATVPSYGLPPDEERRIPHDNVADLLGLACPH